MFPKSSVEVTSECTSVLHALSGRDDLIRAIFRNRPNAVRHMRVTCVRSSCQQGCGQVPVLVLVLVLKYNFVST